MRGLAILSAVCLLTLSVGPARADDAPKLSITIYNSNIALVQDQRTIEIPAGRTRLEFKDVSAAIRPETVTLSAPGATIIEQNFDYDLLTPDKLMEKAVGQQVRIVRTNPGNGQQVTESATVLAVNDGVVLKIGDRIEVLRDDGVPTRVIFDKIPENLRARPTLSVTVEAAKAGPRPATLSYLTSGLTWKADYVALFDDAAGKLDVQGWITLTNTSGTAFVDAETQLVAGQTSRTMGYRDATSGGMARGGAGTERGTQASVGDLYIYPLPERTTIAQNQTKQVSFLDAKGVPAAKVYRYQAQGLRSRDQPDHVETVLEFTNSSAAGLAAQLPQGVVRIYMRGPDGAPKFIGENNIDHTPQGSHLAIPLGEAFDVTVQPTLVSTESVDKTHTRYVMRYDFKSARDTPVSVSLEQGGFSGRPKIEKESQASRRIDAGTLAWDVAVPARGETSLTFTVVTGY